MFYPLEKRPLPLDQAKLLENHPPRPPIGRHLWTAIVDIGAQIDQGPGLGGHLFIVPILGGSFMPGPTADGLSGQVLPGGADRQFLRADGVRELDAVYDMQTDSGAILSISNRVIIDEARQPERYAMSVISVKTGDTALDWLNRRVIVGTLQTARPARDAVIIRAWELDAQ
jgi:hypothetical protein